MGSIWKAGVSWVGVAHDLTKGPSLWSPIDTRRLSREGESLRALLLFLSPVPLF